MLMWPDLILALPMLPCSLQAKHCSLNMHCIDWALHPQWRVVRGPSKLMDCMLSSWWQLYVHFEREGEVRLQSRTKTKHARYSTNCTRLWPLKQENQNQISKAMAIFMNSQCKIFALSFTCLMHLQKHCNSCVRQNVILKREIMQSNAICII